MDLVKTQDGEDVHDTVKSSEKGVSDPDSVLAVEAQRAATPPPRPLVESPNQLQQVSMYFMEHFRTNLRAKLKNGKLQVCKDWFTGVEFDP
jgi:hypothetical protein